MIVPEGASYVGRTVGPSVELVELSMVELSIVELSAVELSAVELSVGLVDELVDESVVIVDEVVVSLANRGRGSLSLLSPLSRYRSSRR